VFGWAAARSKRPSRSSVATMIVFLGGQAKRALHATSPDPTDPDPTDPIDHVSHRGTSGNPGQSAARHDHEGFYLGEG